MEPSARKLEVALLDEIDDMDPAGPGPTPPELLRKGWANEQWVSDTFADVYRRLAAVEAIKRDKRQPKVWLQLPTEVLKAFELGVITKPEARKIMGLAALRKRPQPPGLARAAAARKAGAPRR